MGKIIRKLSEKGEPKREIEDVLDMVKHRWVSYVYVTIEESKDPKILLAAIDAQEQGQVLRIPKGSTIFRGILDSSVYDERGTELYDYVYSPLAWAPKFQDKREFVLAAVKKNGMALEYASTELKSDPQIVFEAIKENGDALQFASLELRNNREFVLEALKTSKNAVNFTSVRLQSDRDLIGLLKLSIETGKLPCNQTKIKKIIENLNLEDELVYETTKCLIINPRMHYLKKEMKRMGLQSIEDLPETEFKRIEQLINENLDEIEDQRKSQPKQEHNNEKSFQ